MRIATIPEIQALEKKIIDSGISAAALMEQAGQGMTRALQHHFPDRRQILILVGKGNNGGDGLVVARLLAQGGWQVHVHFAEEKLAPLPTQKQSELRRCGFPISISRPNDPIPWPNRKGLVLDALLGIGIQGSLRSPYRELVALTNTVRRQLFFRTIAVDLPSGLQLETTHPDDAIEADLTLTIGFPKDLLVQESLSPWVGRLEVIPLFAGTESQLPEREELLTAPELRPLLPRRNALSHKGNYGRVLIVAGSQGFTGAATLASTAALYGGAGLITVATHPKTYPIVAAQTAPEIMVIPWNDRRLAELLTSSTVIAIGPGLGQGRDSLPILQRILKTPRIPFVLDADALNLIAAHPTLLKSVVNRAILTPHPGEMQRLVGHPLRDRLQEAETFAKKHRVTLVLKGTRTVIADASGKTLINSTGNPGLSSGGSGDVLTGLIAAMIGQGLSLVDAARLGVWLHGRAADLLLEKSDVEEGLRPLKIAEEIPAALADLRHFL